MGFTLTSAAFRAGGTIPPAHTCDGQDASPPLAWTGPPPGTNSFALISDDPDAPGRTWVHWVVYNLPPSARRLPEAFPPDEACKRSSGLLVGFHEKNHKKEKWVSP